MVLSQDEQWAQVMERDGRASVISGQTDDLVVVKRQPYRPPIYENLITVTLDERARLEGDPAMHRIALMRGWHTARYADLLTVPVSAHDGDWMLTDTGWRRPATREEVRR